jgi:deoxyribose-phosphate aldolase
VETALTDDDLRRIVQRVAELARQPGSPCADLACAFCKVCAQVNPELVRQLVDLGAERIGHPAGPDKLGGDLARYIDHTLLKADAAPDDVRRLCDEARQFGFASVCINPTYVALAASCLRGTAVKVCAVVGFPLGAHTSQIKAAEARQAIRDGAREIDMVINIGALKGGDDEAVYRDIRAVTETCIDSRSICKVIIETALLSDQEKVRACQAARRARADYVKTSTGFGPSGATAHDVALMADAVRGTSIGVKASGGIRSLQEAREMIEAGATRLGVSAGVKIIKEAKGVTVSGDSSGKY